VPGGAVDAKVAFDADVEQEKSRKAKEELISKQRRATCGN
jgi:hypothetical protein